MADTPVFVVYCHVHVEPGLTGQFVPVGPFESRDDARLWADRNGVGTGWVQAHRVIPPDRYRRVVSPEEIE